jgi:hypothetical protein
VAVNVWAKPEPSYRYTVGGDVAEGKLSDQQDADSDRDYSAASVFCRNTREYVATLHCRLDPHRYALWLYLLGRWYNNAWLCPELNNNGVAVLGVLRGTVQVPGYDLPTYPHIYARETSFDRYSGNIAPDLLGWKTTTLSRPKLISDFYTLFVDGPCGIYDALMVEEAKSFQRNRLGKAEHTSGFHDDVLFSAMLALQADLWCPQLLGASDYEPKPMRYGINAPDDAFEVGQLAYIGARDMCEDLEEDDDA